MSEVRPVEWATSNEIEPVLRTVADAVIGGIALLGLGLAAPILLAMDYFRPDRPRSDVPTTDPRFGMALSEDGSPDCARCSRPEREHIQMRVDWEYSMPARCPVQRRFGTKRYLPPRAG